MKRIDWRLTLCSCVLLPVLVGCGSDDGGGDEPGGSFAGQKFVLTIKSGDWLDEIGGEVSDYVPKFWLDVGGSGTNYQVGIAAAQGDQTDLQDPGVQDLCNQTVTVPAASNPYPGFVLGPTDFPLYLRHAVQAIAVQATAYDFTMTDVLPMGTGLPTDESNSFKATLDARQIYTLFAALTPNTADRLCESIQQENRGMCMPCRDGEPYCITLMAGFLEAVPNDSIAITPVPTPDPACIDPAALQ